MIWLACALGGLFLIAVVWILWAQLRGSFDALHRNLFHFQEQVDRARELTSQALRAELAEQLQSNRKELQAGLSNATESWERRFATLHEGLDNRLKALNEGVQHKLELNLKEGFMHFEKVQEHLRRAEGQLQNLNQVGSSIQDLNNLLRLPHLRGGFGETTLERILSDCLPAGAFELQYRVQPDSTERVDAIIRFPQFVIPIDSKFPREQFTPLFEGTGDPEMVQTARKQLVETIRILGRSIRDKYIHPEHGTSDLALLFIPSETIYFEILRNPKLCEELRKFQVFPVSPNTLTITVQAVALSRNYYEMARGVEKTLDELRKTQQHCGHFEQRFEDVGKHLSRAVESFQVAGHHWQRYIRATERLTETPTPKITTEASEPESVTFS